MFLPNNPNTPTDIYVPAEATKGAKDGEMVVVAVTDWREAEPGTHGKELRRCLAM